jgi:bacteriorhodopsin
MNQKTKNNSLIRASLLLSVAAAVWLPTTAHAATSATTSAVILESSDFVGVSFWLISMALVAATAFFFLEMLRVPDKWKTSLTVSGLVTMVAAVHYFYMRDVWVETGATPTVYRYIDWLITVPLLMVEFYFILSAVTKVSGAIFWRLILGSLVMLIGGYLGEAGHMNLILAFIIGMAGWLYILYEVFLGEASKVNAKSAPPAVQSAFKTMRMIVTFGWAIYPVGYFVAYFVGNSPEDSMNFLNITYNLADVLNKIAFGLVIWSAATSQMDDSKLVVK